MGECGGFADVGEFWLGARNTACLPADEGGVGKVAWIGLCETERAYANSFSTMWIGVCPGKGAMFTGINAERFAEARNCCVGRGTSISSGCAKIITY